MTTVGLSNPKSVVAQEDLPDLSAKAIFSAIAQGEETLNFFDLAIMVRKCGLLDSDPRLEEFRKSTKDYDHKTQLTEEQFVELLEGQILIAQALCGFLTIPDFETFCEEVVEVFDEVEPIKDGANADYIPQLAEVDPEQFGVSVCTVSGQQFHHGDYNVDFCVQSCSKPISYCIALEQEGADEVERHIGTEPSGVAFNSMVLNPRGLPHNPMINAGAIMSVSMLFRDLNSGDRFSEMTKIWTRLFGGKKIGFSNSTYLSERETADRNFCLGYMMKESGAFPDGCDMIQTLETYFQVCSQEVTCEKMAIMAATLANAGVNPLTGDRIFKAETVKMCLSLMLSCGMYDYSGQWAFRMGIPAKSGVGGCVFAVVPGVAGFATFSPRLDAQGNSVRGVAFYRELLTRFNFHCFDILEGGEKKKKDPRGRKRQLQHSAVIDLLWAAAEGDADQLRNLVARGVNVNDADYDMRTALHLAASEGQMDAVRYLTKVGADPSAKDRWGGTPLDDAVRQGHSEVEQFLKDLSS